ncbi:indole-3-glycerol phosphate synthase TrpC [Blattabacterium cuenoti]|uniref:indole-3-glycerol phosphate synthase TrpC n=1 Tax=Blattabacterium cuenoti TaxID=1653831 RepID=UPI00163CBAD3|nr:indole-3-glycerol phosphate synthase TrpC [Blattabacterium cuenoti]
MNILEKILAKKKIEIEINKNINSIKKLENNVLFNRNIISLKKSIKKNLFGVIAEFKLKSPSKGIINSTSIVENVVKKYFLAKVSGISILTDYHFSGCINHIKKSRPLVSIPLLRKDFIIDEYQVIESKSIGADVILLIASILSKKKIKILSKIARSIGLEVIIELHNESELEKITDNIDFIGINNRDLKSFNVNKKNSFVLYKKIPCNYIKLAESGINNIEDIINLKKLGFDGFLIGEYFMKEKDPGKKCINLMKLLNNENYKI